jgi:hypothetical protein
MLSGPEEVFMADLKMLLVDLHLPSFHLLFGSLSQGVIFFLLLVTIDWLRFFDYVGSLKLVF